MSAPASAVGDAHSSRATARKPSRVVRPVQLPANVGAAVTWEFEDGCLEVQDTESLLLWNLGAGAGAVLDVSCFFEGT